MSSSTELAGPEPSGPAATAAATILRLLRFDVAGLFGVVPFLVFALLFLIVPTLYLVGGAFFDKAGNLTLANFAELTQPTIVSAYVVSIKVSAASAGLGAFAGFMLALTIARGGLPPWIRATALTFSGVASNFAGIPLAFAFLATLGRLGLVTIILKTVLGVDLYRTGFNILSFWGLTLTYLYFQIPLMILIVMPALDGLKGEWSEAAQTLGASRWQFWRYVGLPVLWPNILGTLALLFANSFGAIATAYALTGSSLNIVPILLYAQIRGDVLHNENLGAALALGMVLITGVANLIYIVFRTRAERWLK